ALADRAHRAPGGRAAAPHRAVAPLVEGAARRRLQLAHRIRAEARAVEVAHARVADLRDVRDRHARAQRAGEPRAARLARLAREAAREVDVARLAEAVAAARAGLRAAAGALAVEAEVARGAAR